MQHHPGDDATGRPGNPAQDNTQGHARQHALESNDSADAGMKQAEHHRHKTKQLKTTLHETEQLLKEQEHASGGDDEVISKLRGELNSLQSVHQDTLEENQTLKNHSRQKHAQNEALQARIKEVQNEAQAAHEQIDVLT